MRILCLLLILANVLYFTWSQMIDVSVPSLERKGAKPVDPPARIVLAREMIEANPDERSVGPIRDVQPPGTHAAADGPTRTAQLDALSCTSVGPFADLPQAAQAQASLRNAGFQPR